MSHETPREEDPSDEVNSLQTRTLFNPGNTRSWIATAGHSRLGVGLSSSCRHTTSTHFQAREA